MKSLAESRGCFVALLLISGGVVVWFDLMLGESVDIDVYSIVFDASAGAGAGAISI